MADIIPVICTDLRHKLSTYMINESGGVVEALSVLLVR